LEMGDWDGTAGYIYDLSFVNSTQCWMLTYNVKGDAKRWAHLVNLSAADKFSKTSTGGTTAAGGTSTFTVSLDTTGLSIGWYPVTLTFASDDPDEPVIEKELIFIVHEDAPNNAPTANAGPDVTREIPGVTAPFILALDGSGSTDPDGDTLFSSWTMDGQPVVTTDKGLIELGAGTYIFELTVDDLRGGADSDSFTMTVNAKQPAEGWRAWHGSYGTGHACETNENWLENWPPIVAWVKVGLGGGGYSGNSGPVVSDGRVYYGSNNGKMTCLDAATGVTLWQCSHPGGNPVPAVDEDRVYAGTRSGESSRRSRLACFDKRTGDQLWITGDIGPGSDADGSGEWISPMVHGDLVFYGGHALNKYTGKTMWSGGSAVDHKPVDYNGRTLMLHGSSAQLKDPLTGANVVSAGGTTRNAESWYYSTCLYGADKTWTIGSVMKFGGSAISSWGDLGSVTYTQPFTIRDRGYFIQGGHGGGGAFNSVDLHTGQKWTLGGAGTALAVRDNAIGHGGGSISLYSAVATGLALQSFQFDPAGANALSEAAYANQRMYIVGGTGLTCLYFGLSAPVLNNGAGALWSDAGGTASLNGELVNAGNGGTVNTSAPPTQVYAYWGRTDGGTNRAAWEHCEELGPRTRGPFSAVVSPDRDAVYYYRCFASNSIGATWASASQRFTTYSCAWDVLGLVLHWPFEGTSGTTVADVSGNGNHGGLVNTWNSAPITWDVRTDGVIGKGLGFTGNERARCQQLSVPLVSDFTLSFWLSYTTTFDGNGTQITIMTLSCSSGGSAVINVADASRTGWDRRLVGPAGWSKDALHDGLWHNVVLVRQGMSYLMYVDGVWNTSAGASVLTAFNQIAFTWIVKYDDVRLYRRALSVEEIRGLAEVGDLTDNGSQATCTAIAGSDDAEERESDGGMYLDRTDLCLVAGAQPGDGNQKVGLRFPNVGIPRGAFIASATIQFRSAANRSDAACLLIRGQASDDAAVFGAGVSNISARATTRAAVEWMPPAWSSGQAGASQQTPDLAGIVQEVVDRDGWVPSNAVAFVISGTGVRVADAHENPAGTPASLQVVWVDAPDMDGNGVPDVWEREHFGTASVDAFRLDRDDDGDGMLSSREYIAGTDPMDKASVFKLQLRILPDHRFVVECDVHAAQGLGYEGLDRYMTLESCGALSSNGTGWAAIPTMQNRRVAFDGTMSHTNSA
ncbi:PQQ-binding-like beta-propeller repeat protein, partial [Verrucomicrobiota bacterium]